MRPVAKVPHVVCTTKMRTFRTISTDTCAPQVYDTITNLGSRLHQTVQKAKKERRDFQSFVQGKRLTNATMKQRGHRMRPMVDCFFQASLADSLSRLKMTGMTDSTSPSTTRRAQTNLSQVGLLRRRRNLPETIRGGSHPIEVWMTQDRSFLGTRVYFIQHMERFLNPPNCTK